MVTAHKRAPRHLEQGTPLAAATGRPHKGPPIDVASNHHAVKGRHDETVGIECLEPFDNGSGHTGIGLGPRILRADTAAVAALTFKPKTPMSSPTASSIFAQR